MAQQIICGQCGYIGYTQRAVKGSIGIEIVLWLFFIIPGLIYSLWRMSSKHNVCPTCASSNLVPLDSPNGQRMLRQQGKTLEQARSEIKKPPMPLIVKALIGGVILVPVLLILGIVQVAVSGL